MYGLAWSWNRWAALPTPPPRSPLSPVSPIPFLSPFSGAAFLAAIPFRCAAPPPLHPDLHLHRPAASSAKEHRP
uniref:Uncharacterized protein n=1 Tax=Oryza nivara TaxID=4536 RepID=A0A0E0IEC4_ORYNI